MADKKTRRCQWADTDGMLHYDGRGYCQCVCADCGPLSVEHCTCPEVCACPAHRGMVTRVEVSPVPQHQAVTVTMDLDLTELAKALLANEDFQGLMRSLAQQNRKGVAT